MLEDKLRNIKDKMVRRLGQREMEQQEYFKAVHDILRKEGLTKGKYSTENMELAVAVGEGIRVKLEAEVHQGLNNSYVCLKDKELSIEAEHDVRSLNSLVEYAGRHIRQKAGDGAIMESDFKQMIKSYISTQALIPVSDSLVKLGAIGIAYARLSREFNVVDVPVKYGEVNKHELREAIERL